MTLQIPSPASTFLLPRGHGTVEIQTVSNWSRSPAILKCQTHWCSWLLHFSSTSGSWASWSLCRCTLSVWWMAENMWHLSPALEMQSKSFGTGIHTLQTTSLLGNRMLSQWFSIPLGTIPSDFKAPHTHTHTHRHDNWWSLGVKYLCSPNCSQIKISLSPWQDESPSSFFLCLVLLTIYPKSKSTQKINLKNTPGRTPQETKQAEPWREKSHRVSVHQPLLQPKNDCGHFLGCHKHILNLCRWRQGGSNMKSTDR